MTGGDVTKKMFFFLLQAPFCKFQLGDLVWAKMKSFPAWPGKIVMRPDHIKLPTVKQVNYGSKYLLLYSIYFQYSPRVGKTIGQLLNRRTKKLTQQVIRKTDEVQYTTLSLINKGQQL